MQPPHIVEVIEENVVIPESRKGMLHWQLKDDSA